LLFQPGAPHRELRVCSSPEQREGPLLPIERFPPRVFVHKADYTACRRINPDLQIVIFQLEGSSIRKSLEEISPIDQIEVVGVITNRRNLFSEEGHISHQEIALAVLLIPGTASLPLTGTNNSPTLS
jgi:hypothetical protein